MKSKHHDKTSLSDGEIPGHEQVQCEACKNLIPKKVKACPECGHPNIVFTGWIRNTFIVIGILIIVSIVIFQLNGY